MSPERGIRKVFYQELGYYQQDFLKIVTELKRKDGSLGQSPDDEQQFLLKFISYCARIKNGEMSKADLIHKLSLTKEKIDTMAKELGILTSAEKNDLEAGTATQG